MARSITETELIALSWGRVGVPVIFASGDDRLAADLATMPWADGTVNFVAGDLGEAYDGMVALIGVATLAFGSTLREAVDARPDRREIMAAWEAAHTKRWLDQASGRYTPPAPAKVTGRFHGDR